MKAKINGIEIVGKPDEFAKLIKKLRNVVFDEIQELPHQSDGSPLSNSDYVYQVSEVFDDSAKITGDITQKTYTSYEEAIECLPEGYDYCCYAQMDEKSPVDFQYAYKKDGKDIVGHTVFVGKSEINCHFWKIRSIRDIANHIANFRVFGE
jgi:hypothetical protein